MNSADISLELTETALGRFREVMDREGLEPGTGVRISIVKGGCSGMEYAMKYAPEPAEGDIELEREGVRIFLDPESLPYLEGTTIDYVMSLTREGFQFRNPNATRTCGCGESFGV